MLKKLSFFLIGLMLLGPFYGHAEVQSIDFMELVNQGADLAHKGQWNQSETLFLKAAQSPVPDQRVLAYAGLAQLYGKLKLTKKAENAKKQLRYEKAFIEKLVPNDPSFYTNYKVQKGETYAIIAAREGISLEWFKRANQRKKLIEGDTVLLPAVKYSIVVNKTTKFLEWRRGEEILKIYPVAVGKKTSETPEGEYTVTSRVRNPVWYYLKLQFPPGDPKNLLGTRWLGLNVKGYGIHGTKNPASIGSAASHGCVRMFNKDVEELFEWIPIGTKVTIKS